MFEEEAIPWPFVHRDPITNEIDYRSALIFQNATEFRNTSKAEREVLQQAQYQAYLDAIQYAQDHPDEQPPEEG